MGLSLNTYFKWRNYHGGVILWVVRLYCRYGQVIRELKREGKSPSDIEHRHVKYLNNVFEAPDHGKLKRLIKPTLGFEAMK